jgi:chemotaxis protein methyltransferase CheR
MTATDTLKFPSSMVEGEFLLTQADFLKIANMLQSETGITLHEGKATLLYSRLGKRLRALGFTAFKEYCELVSHPDGVEERGQMIRALTTNVTRFFREPHHFTHLRDVVLPPLLRAAERGARVRLWSAACSTGMEPYSIGLTVLGLLPTAAQLDVRVLATDIDTAVLAEARAGRYSSEAMAGAPPALVDRWFERTEDGHRAGPELNKMTVFRPLNLIKPLPMKGPFEAIFCRNVVIYFADADQQAIWSRFEPLLISGGHLYVGHSERVGGPAAAAFTSVGITIYQKRGGA